MKKPQATEIVSVAFLPEIHFEQQQQAMASLTQAVSQFEGFVSREYFYSETLNRWTDVIQWDDEEKAKLASEQIMAEPCAQAAFPLMDQTSLIMGHFVKVG